MALPRLYSGDVGSGRIRADNREMNLRKAALAAVFGLGLVGIAVAAEPCPKVNTTTETPATLRAIVKAVNCLIDSGSAPATGTAAFRTEARGALQVDTWPIVGPQHTRTYPGFLLAILTMPVDNAQKSVAVTPDSPQVTIRGASGGECKLTLNSDRTIDAQCSQAGGTVFVVYR